MFSPMTHASRADRTKRKNLGSWRTPFAVAAWKMKDGRSIKLRDMGDTHLENTIKLIIRKCVTIKTRADYEMLAGPIPSGDMASMAFDEMCLEQAEMSFTDYVPDIYWEMVEEYTFRGLNVEALNTYARDYELRGTVAALQATMPRKGDS